MTSENERFWHLPIICWLPTAAGFVVGDSLFRVGVLVTLALYGVLITGVHEEDNDE